MTLYFYIRKDQNKLMDLVAIVNATTMRHCTNMVIISDDSSYRTVCAVALTVSLFLCEHLFLSFLSI